MRLRLGLGLGVVYSLEVSPCGTSRYSRAPKAPDLWCVEVRLRAMLTRGALREDELAHVDEGFEPLCSRVQNLVNHALHRREEPVPRVVANSKKDIDATSGGGGGGWQRRERVA